ncbi:MAG: hypothetical protein MH204_03555, partial [Fimbriimonadaceae bacterium]|nr:hypothetical protein [Fimbriimonadaceae bacterium]
LRKQPTSFKGGEDFIFTIEVTPTEGFILGPTPKYTPFSVPLRAELYTPKPPADPKDKKAAAAYAQEKAATITALLINWDQKALPPPVAVTVAGEKSKGYPATIQLKFKGSFSKLKAGEKLTGKFGVAIMGQSGNKNEKPMTLPPGFRVESAMITVTG